MTFPEFIKKYTGKRIDFDTHFGYQCVDLYRQYVKEVLELEQSPAVVGAVDIWKTFLKDKFIAITNQPPLIPNPGDIIIWNTGIGKYGHVAIFVSGNVKQFTSFDQNYPSGSVCHQQNHDYKNVIGWLTPKMCANCLCNYCKKFKE